MKLRTIVSWAAAGLALLIVASALRPGRPVKGYDLEAFGRLPVLENGRVKPVDSVARNALRMIRSKQTFSGEVPEGDGKDGRKVKARFDAKQWLLDVMFRPDRAQQYPVFVIDDPEVLGLLKIEQRGSRTYASFDEIVPRIDEVQRQAMTQPTDGQGRRVQRASQNLIQRAELHFKLAHTIWIPGATKEQVLAGVRSPQIVEELEGRSQFRPIPPAAGAKPDAWHSVARGMARTSAGNAADRPFLEGWEEIGQAWAAQDPGAFNAAVSSLSALYRASYPGAVSLGRWEVVFNRSDPFYLGMMLYMLALLVLFVSWLWRPDALQRGAWILLIAGLAVHTVGITARVLLGGYAPVTNLYSSAVVVGWVAVVLGALLELRYPRGFGTLGAAVIGSGTLIVAQNLADTGDTMEMMRAVLDSNFWLATHVITIIIGYGGTYLAGFLAIVATVYRHVAPGRDRADDRLLSTMIYGVVCFALFFSFVGTVLGGIWADQSWGRFWGWDPKENGALLIVLWNAVILHARWGGYAREKGIAAMAIFGNVITSLSWFGVNMLGVGLHSYGFMDAAAFWLSAFCASQLLLMALALAPERFWTAESWRAASRERATRGQATGSAEP